MRNFLLQRKSKLVIVFLTLGSLSLIGQIKVNSENKAGVGLGINDPIDARASLEIRSNINGNIGGLLLPIVTNVSEIPPSVPAGLMVYQSSNQKVCYYNTAWVCLEAPGGGGGGNQVISRDGTTLNLSNSGGSLPNSLVPESGTTGYVLTKTAAGYEWQLNNGGNTNLSLSAGSSPVSLNSSTGADVTISAGSNISLSSTSTNVTINATEVDGSITNEIQNLSQSASPGKDMSISSGNTVVNVLVPNNGSSGQVLTKTATNYDWQNLPTITEVDGVIGNEVLNATTNGGLIRAGSGTAGSPYTLGLPAATSGQVMKFNGTSWVPDNDNGITSEIDGLITNEGSLTVSAGTSTTSLINSNTSASTPVTISTGSGLSITETGNTITLTNTGVITEIDGITTNEGTLGVTAGTGTTSIITSNTSGSNGVTLEAGANITLTETTSANGGTITISASGGSGATDLSVSGTSSPLILNSSTGTDVTLNAGSNVTLIGTSTSVTINATEVDGSITNEGSLNVLPGTSTTSLINSNTNSSTPVTLSTSAGLSITESGNTITLANTGVISEVDGSVTNEIQTLSQSASPGKDISISAGNTVTNVLVPSNGTTGQVLTKTASGYDWQNATAGAEVDGVIGNEVLDATVNGGLIRAGSGTNASPYTLGLPAAITNDVMKYNGVSWVALPEGDGSITNEGNLSVGVGASNTSLINSNTVGSPAVTLTAGSGLSITESGNVITLTNTGDLSTTNEGLIGVALGSGTSSIITSTTSGAVGVTINAGGIISLTETTSSNGGHINITATEVDGSTTNELQTLTQSASPGKNLSISSGNTLSNVLVPSNGATGQVLTKSTTGYDWQNVPPMTEVDGSITNEGLLGVAAGTSTSSIITSNTSTSPSITLNVAFPRLQITENVSTNNITIQNETPSAQLSMNDTSADTPLSHSTTNAYSKIAIPTFAASLLVPTSANEISIPSGFPGAFYQANYSFCVSAGSTEVYDVALFKTTGSTSTEIKFSRSKKSLTTGALDCFSKDVIITLFPGDKIDLRVKKTTATSTTSTIHTPVLNLIYLFMAV